MWYFLDFGVDHKSVTCIITKQKICTRKTLFRVRYILHPICMNVWPGAKLFWFI